MLINLCCSELVAKETVCDKGYYGDDDRCSCPEIHTPSIKILAIIQTLQFQFPV